MFEQLKKKIKDFFEIKESFLICEETEYHPIVNEVTNSFMVVKVMRLGDIAVSEQVIFSDLPTYKDAEKFAKAFVSARDMKRGTGVKVISKL